MSSINSLPTPRPEYETADGGFAYFYPGDIVRMKNAFPEYAQIVGVVVVEPLRIDDENPDWFIRWENGHVDDFKDIPGSALVVVFSNGRVVEQSDEEEEHLQESIQRDYIVSFDLSLTYFSDEEGLGERLDEDIDALSVLHDNLCMDIQGALNKFRREHYQQVELSGGGLRNVSDITGE